MQLTPSLVLVVAAVLGLAVAFSLMMVGALWARVQAFPVEETTRRVDDLKRRQESIEALLVRMEVTRGPGKAGQAGGKGGRGAAVHRDGRPTAGESRSPEGPRADPGEPSAIGGPTLIAIPNLSTAAPEASAVAAAELGRRFGAIWALADAGQAPDSIARATSQPVGQVELILGLRRQLLSGSGMGCRT